MVLGSLVSRQTLPAGTGSNGPVIQGPSLSQLCTMADALSRLSEEAVVLFDDMTEDELAAHIQMGINTVQEQVKRFDTKLLVNKMGWDAALRVVTDDFKAQGGLIRGLPEWGPQEIVASMRTLSNFCCDLQTTLEEVSKNEIQEVADAGLIVARMVCSSLHRKAKKFQDSVQPEPLVVIEDLEEEETICGAEETEEEEEEPNEADSIASFSTRASDNRFCCRRATEPKVEFLQSRYLWRPLWPQFKGYVRRPHVPKRAQHLFQKAYEKPLAAAAVVSVSWPVAVGTGTAAACALPWALLGDSLLQRLYASRRQEVDDSVEASLQVGKLAYTSGRLAARKFCVLAKAQFMRAFDDRTPEEVLRDSWDIVRKDPAAAAKQTTQYSLRIGRGLFNHFKNVYSEYCAFEEEYRKRMKMPMHTADAAAK